MVGLECFLDVVRALGMGSCLSADGSAAAYGSVPSSDSKRRMRRVAAISSPSSTTPSADNVEMWLHRVHDRMFLNGSSDFTSLFSKQGKKGVNQDAMIAWEVLCFFSLLKCLSNHNCIEIDILSDSLDFNVAGL